MRPGLSDTRGSAPRFAGRQALHRHEAYRYAGEGEWTRVAQCARSERPRRSLRRSVKARVPDDRDGLEASVPRRWRESSKLSSPSVGADATFRGIAIVNADLRGRLLRRQCSGALRGGESAKAIVREMRAFRPRGATDTGRGTSPPCRDQGSGDLRIRSAPPLSEQGALCSSSSDPSVSVLSIWPRLSPAPPQGTSPNATAETSGLPVRASIECTSARTLPRLLKRSRRDSLRRGGRFVCVSTGAHGYVASAGESSIRGAPVPAGSRCGLRRLFGSRRRSCRFAWGEVRRSARVEHL